MESARKPGRHWHADCFYQSQEPLTPTGETDMKQLGCTGLFLVAVCLFSPESARGAGIGFGINAGLTMPGDGQFQSSRNLINQYEPWRPVDVVPGSSSNPTINQVAGHVTFHGKQIGIEFCGEMFLRFGRFQFGLDASHQSRDNLKASLLTGTEPTLSGLHRTFTSAQLSFRMDLSRQGPATPYAGFGLGAYRLREHIRTNPANAQEGLLIQGIAGLSTAAGPGTKLFTELRLNLAGLDESPGRDKFAMTTFGLSVGIRFGG